MTSPEWLKPGLYGAVIGAIAISIVGFSWAGWMTGGNAGKLAKNQAQEEVVTALVPVCLELSRTDPDRIAKLETIKSANGFNRRKAIMDAGWATAPGKDTPDRNLATACLAGLKIDV
jgi:hypothetical protein